MPCRPRALPTHPLARQPTHPLARSLTLTPTPTPSPTILRSYALQGGHTRCVEELLAAGANASAAALNGSTPLHIAAGSRRAVTCATLLASGADVRAADDKQQTALHLCITDQRSEDDLMLTAAVLLAAGADPNAVDADRKTPLHQAAWKEQGELCALLLLAGARVDAVAKQGFRWAPPPLPALRASVVGAGWVGHAYASARACRPRGSLKGRRQDG